MISEIEITGNNDGWLLDESPQEMKLPLCLPYKPNKKRKKERKASVIDSWKYHSNRLVCNFYLNFLP